MIYVLIYIVSFEHIEYHYAEDQPGTEAGGPPSLLSSLDEAGAGGLWRSLSSTSLDEAGLGVATSIIIVLGGRCRRERLG